MNQNYDVEIFYFQGGILNLSRKDKLRAQGLLGSVSESGKSDESSDDENEPLLRNRKRIN